jgi:hypothetical protein
MHEFFLRYENAFGRIKCDPKWNSFYLNGNKMLGVTKFVGSFIPPFDEARASISTAKKWSENQGHEVTPEEVIQVWHHKRDVSTNLGNAVHGYIEAALQNKPFAYPKDAIAKAFPNDTTDPVREKYDSIIKQVNIFRENSRGKLIPVKSEAVIGSPKYQVCGLVDQIFWNETAKEFQIWDWKTNDKMDRSSSYKFNPPFDTTLDNCDYHKYSMQLTLYKKIFMEETGIPIGKCFLCWFCSDIHPTEGGPLVEHPAQFIPIREFNAEADQMLTIRARDLGIVDQGSIF